VRAILPDDTPLLDLPGLVCGMPLPTNDTVLADAHGNPKVYKFNLQSHEQKMDLDGQLYNAPLSDEEDLGIPAHLAKPVPMDSMKAKAKAKPFDRLEKVFIIQQTSKKQYGANVPAPNDAFFADILALGQAAGDLHPSQTPAGARNIWRKHLEEEDAEASKAADQVLAEKKKAARRNNID